MIYKIIVIVIISVVLLFVETLVYILFRNLLKNKYYSKRHLDDAYIAGIAAIIVIAIMLWQNIE